MAVIKDEELGKPLGRMITQQTSVDVLEKYRLPLLSEPHQNGVLSENS